MPVDFTMCPGEACPLRNDCYRYRAVPAARQDWLVRPPFDPGTRGCEGFVALPAITEEQIRMRAYLLWQEAGEPHGQAERYWHRAESELHAELAARLREV